MRVHSRCAPQEGGEARILHGLAAHELQRWRCGRRTVRGVCGTQQDQNVSRFTLHLPVCSRGLHGCRGIVHDLQQKPRLLAAVYGLPTLLLEAEGLGKLRTAAGGVGVPELLLSDRDPQ